MADPKEEVRTPDTLTATATQAEVTTQNPQAEERISISPSSPRSEKRTCVIDKEFESNSSASTESTAEGAQPQTRPWYKTSNPLRWGGVPPVPSERIISPEHNSGLLSRLTFGWVTTLMVVSLHPCIEKAWFESMLTHLSRLAINVNLTNATSGK